MIKALNEASQLTVTKIVEDAKILTTDTSTMGPEAQALYAMKRQQIMLEMEMAMTDATMAAVVRAAAYTPATATTATPLPLDDAESPAVPEVMEETVTPSSI
jgi:hypothetical protein